MVVSRRDVLERERAEHERGNPEVLEEGNILEGTVKTSPTMAPSSI